MEPIECMVVDDEPLAVLQMRDFIGRIPGFILKADFSKGMDALTYLQANKVDLLFLDIQMDDINGIQMLKAMKDGPVTILTTAYEQYALKGFELDVCDYLLKPISFDRFVRAAFKAGKIISARRNIGNLEESTALPPEDHDHIYIKSGYKLFRIGLDEIFFIEGCGDYLKIHTVNGHVKTLLSFAKLQTMLPAEEFIRIHRSFIIPLSKIRSTGKNWILIGQKRVPLGDYYKKDFLKRLNQYGINPELKHDDPGTPCHPGTGNP